MPSQRRLAPIVGKAGIRPGHGREQNDGSTVEIDATFGWMIGLREGQKVSHGDTHLTFSADESLPAWYTAAP